MKWFWPLRQSCLPPWAQRWHLPSDSKRRNATVQSSECNLNLGRPYNAHRAPWAHLQGRSDRFPDRRDWTPLDRFSEMPAWSVLIRKLCSHSDIVQDESAWPPSPPCLSLVGISELEPIRAERLVRQSNFIPQSPLKGRHVPSCRHTSSRMIVEPRPAVT